MKPCKFTTLPSGDAFGGIVCVTCSETFSTNIIKCPRREDSVEFNNRKEMIEFLNDENHKLHLIRETKTGRTSDGTWYCIAAVYWCSKTGSLVYIKKVEPYSSKLKVVIRVMGDH